ncbi:MAG: hypothetical protein OXH37_03490, partial [Gammaproteobacteria bacterium]|nr:hypothetical protein [Gammaproteobacteria bacterium]
DFRSNGRVRAPASRRCRHAERRYGGVMEDELLMALPPRFLPKIIAGLEALSRNGLRYPIAPYGVNNDVRAGMGVSYG